MRDKITAAFQRGGQHFHNSRVKSALRLFRRGLFSARRSREVRACTCRFFRRRSLVLKRELFRFEAETPGKVFPRELRAHFPDFLSQIRLYVQVLRFIVFRQRSEHARPGVDLGIQPGNFVPGIRDHRLVGIGQIVGHVRVCLCGRLRVLAFHFHGQRLPHENLTDSPVLAGKERLVQGPLRLPGPFQLDVCAIRNHGHGILHHARKPPRHVLFFQRRGLGRSFPDDPGHTVTLHETRIK